MGSFKLIIRHLAISYCIMFNEQLRSLVSTQVNTFIIYTLGI